MDSILQYALFVHIDDDQVLTDFLSFIPENEKRSFLEGERLIAEGNTASKWNTAVFQHFPKEPEKFRNE